ncbi:hypothetical protein ACFUJY_22030 [Streptomyces sp. NPDC057249]|uniref:hypothetical protein n=1 Tax=Streptomyces sp. NPDC057249 TaxID=3346067 RepID=UPI00362AE3B3
MNHRDREHEQPPRTAVEEVVREAEEAETDVADTRRERHGRDSEAGDALTPNEGAQEDADQ